MDVSRLLAEHPADATAVVCGDDRRSWDELRDRVRRVSSSIGSRVEVGDVVVVLGSTSIDFIEGLLGALASGATVLPLHPRAPIAEIEHACRLATPRLIVGVSAGEVTQALVDSGVIARDGVVDVAELFSSEPGDAPEVDRHAPGLLLFTSGTAGSPRLAMLSRANLAASIESTVRSSDELSTVARTILGVIPLTHVLGVVSVLGVAITVGSTLVLAPDPSVDAVVAAVSDHDVTLLVAPPVFWFRLAEAHVDPASLSSVKLGLSGAAPLNGSLAARISTELGIQLRQGYGLTEASPGLTSSVGTDAPPTSVGRPLPGVELRLVDDFGNDAYIGDVGEVWARGANIFLGYLGDHEATAAVLDDDGWLRTGDLAVVDEQGHLFIVGRSKDQIISAGFNVHPGEVEDRLVQHPDVEAAAVIGVPDPEYGEIVAAFVVLRPGVDPTTIDADALQQHCRSRLAGYKVPRQFEYVDELPQGATGKVVRRALRTG